MELFFLLKNNYEKSNKIGMLGSLEFNKSIETHLYVKKNIIKYLTLIAVYLLKGFFKKKNTTNIYLYNENIFFRKCQ